MDEYISLPVYGKVLGKNKATLFKGDTYEVKSPTYNNELIHISTEIVDTSASFDGRFSSTEKVNKHQLAERLIYSNGTVFKLQFEKQDKSIRTLVGFLSSTDALLGYSTVVDLEQWVETGDAGKSKRTVYHSKLLSVIINNTKYELKS